jgi:hypothetical protein
MILKIVIAAAEDTKISSETAIGSYLFLACHRQVGCFCTSAEQDLNGLCYRLLPNWNVIVLYDVTGFLKNWIPTYGVIKSVASSLLSL